MAEDNQCCCICELLKQAEKEDKWVFYQCNFCCCCSDGNNSGGEDPDPGPDPDPNIPGGDYDPDDPHGENKRDHPGIPLEGEATDVYVTPNLAVNGNENAIVKRTWLSFNKTTHPLTTGDLAVPSNPYTTSVGITTDEIVGTFVRVQYINGYQLAVESNNYQNMPNKWRFYLSADAGQTWELADENEYIWSSTSIPQTWNVNPGFYNAYKFEILAVNGGNQISLKSLRLIGLPTEIIPIVPVNTETLYYGMTLIGDNIYQPQLGVGQYTQPYNNSTINVWVTGYTEYAFETPRKVRSFSMITANAYVVNGWDILGSNDGSNWDTLHSVRNISLSVNKDYYFNLDKVAYYKRYRFVNMSSRNMLLCHFQMYRSAFSEDVIHNA